MNKRKQRQLDRITPADRLISEVKAFSDKPFVRSVEDHFAGYFNELGVTITLADDASDAEVIELRNALLAHFKSATAERELHFTWQVSFWRNLKEIALLFPSSSIHPRVENIEHIF